MNARDQRNLSHQGQDNDSKKPNYEIFQVQSAELLEEHVAEAPVIEDGMEQNKQNSQQQDPVAKNPVLRGILLGREQPKPVALPHYSITELLYPADGVRLKVDRVDPLVVAQHSFLSPYILPVSECYIADTKNTTNKPVKWKLTKSMKFDLDHEMRMKGTIAHCIADFQRFLTDVLEGLIALENRKIRSNFHTVRILIDHQDKVYVAPHNLFLLAQPSEVSRFMFAGGLTQLFDQVKADSTTSIISKNSVGKLLLKLVCLDEKTFAELQNQGTMLESYTNQILSVHKKQLAREALSSEWFIKNLMTIIRKLMVAFTSDRADLQDIRASMTRTDEQVSRLASAW